MELSRATMGRLPGYLHYVRSLPHGTRTISATVIARDLNLGEVQVRKDLAAVCGMGKPKIGYAVSELSEALETALGTHAGCEAVIVGAGRLGTALLGFGGFSEYGLTVSRAFDLQPSGNPAICPVAQLPDYCRTHRVEIGVITVPPDAAQRVAELLVSCGVHALWCFAPVRLRLPPEITVQYENLALSLAHLHQKVKHQNGTEEGDNRDESGQDHCGQEPQDRLSGRRSVHEGL